MQPNLEGKPYSIKTETHNIHSHSNNYIQLIDPTPYHICNSVLGKYKKQRNEQTNQTPKESHTTSQ